MYGQVDYGAIADEAVDEMFGSDDDLFGLRPRAVRRSVQRARARRSTRRAALGSPAWRQGRVPGQDYDVSSLLMDDHSGLGSDYLDAEVDAVLSDDEDSFDDDYDVDSDEYGFDPDDDYGDDDTDLDDEFGDDDVYVDEFGRLRRFMGGRRRVSPGRGRGRSFRQGMKVARQKMRKRRQRRRVMRQSQGSSQGRSQSIASRQNLSSAFPIPSSPGSFSDFFEEDETEEGPNLPPGRVAASDVQLPGRSGGRVAASEVQLPGYGALPPMAPPPSHSPTFTESVVTGAGLGLGFLAMAFGVSVLTRGLSGK